MTPDVPTPTIDDPTAARLASIALGHVTREYPHLLSHAFTGPGDARTPREWHPVFHGSLDWHSCVHGYWLLATLLRQNPGNPQLPAIQTLFNARLTHPLLEVECAYFHRPNARGFERPYGWAWVLALHHALRDTPWATPVAPLAAIIAARFHAYLPKAQYPVRVGTHYNTAFALTLAAPWAAIHDQPLHTLLEAKAESWYRADEACQAWEPSQDDFLSPALIEAVCMLRLAPAAFASWFTCFLPTLATRTPATLFTPATVTDRTDGKIAHLDGLNLSRAWCWRLLAATLPPADPRRPIIDQAAAVHRAAAIPHLEGDFMGEHWLATFALLSLAPNSID